MTKEMAKSTNPVMMELEGIIILGKYTFEISWLLPMRLALDSDTALAKNCQGSMAA